MSDAVSALAGAHVEGLVSVADAGLAGMITLRCDLGSGGLGAALEGLGLEVPGTGAIIGPAGARQAAWMSPDELLLLTGYDSAHDDAAALGAALAGEHALVEVVSDARALFVLKGEGVREVLSRLTPADLRPSRFGPGIIRRTRLAQVPAAIWFPAGDEARVVVFRSVAQYAFDLLAGAAKAHQAGVE